MDLVLLFNSRGMMGGGGRANVKESVINRNRRLKNYPARWTYHEEATGARELLPAPDSVRRCC